MRDKTKINDKNYHCDNFEWYVDELELKTKLKAAPFRIPILSFTEGFYGMYMTIDVAQLKENVLYIPLTHNCAIYDMMYVNHAEKEITMFQVSKRNGNKHHFKMVTIDKVFKNMNVKSSGYTVNLVYVNDWNSLTATGFFFLFITFCCQNFLLKFFFFGLMIKKIRNEF
jgi:hypothetical protein